MYRVIFDSYFPRLASGWNFLFCLSSSLSCIKIMLFINVLFLLSLSSQASSLRQRIPSTTTAPGQEGEKQISGAVFFPCLRRRERVKIFGTCKIPKDLVISTEERTSSELINGERMPERESYLN